MREDHPAQVSGKASTVSEFKRVVTFEPAYDKRNSDPGKDYGIHGVSCRFTLSKDGKGVTFVLFTNWMLPHVQKETDSSLKSAENGYLFHRPLPAGVDYHDNKPHYEGQTCLKDCEVTGGPCYSDGSGLLAEDVYTLLLEKGSAGVWEKMESLYEDWLVKEAA